jgi:hypothetical protein
MASSFRHAGCANRALESEPIEKYPHKIYYLSNLYHGSLNPMKSCSHSLQDVYFTLSEREHMAEVIIIANRFLPIIKIL